MLHKRVNRPNIPETQCYLRVYSMKLRLEKLNYYTFLMSEMLDLYFFQAIMNLKAEKRRLTELQICRVLAHEQFATQFGFLA